MAIYKGKCTSDSLLQNYLLLLLFFACGMSKKRNVCFSSWFWCIDSHLNILTSFVTCQYTTALFACAVFIWVCPVTYGKDFCMKNTDCTGVFKALCGSCAQSGKWANQNVLMLRPSGAICLFVCCFYFSCSSNERTTGAANHMRGFVLKDRCTMKSSPTTTTGIYVYRYTKILRVNLKSKDIKRYNVQTFVNIM